LLGLDRREPGELVLRHRDLGVALEPVGSLAEESGSVGVERLVSRSGSLKPLSRRVDEGRWVESSLPLLEVSNDGPLEGELDEIEREVPNDVPDPNDTDPSTRDTSDVGEAPVSIGGDNRRDELSKQEGTHESIRRSLSPRWTVGSGDEDEGLGDDGNLEVDDHVTSVVVDVLADGVDTESVLEEAGVVHDSEQSDRRGGEVQTVADTVGEHLSQIPRVGSLRWQDSVEGQGHDGTVVEHSNDKDHERWELELPTEDHDGEANDDSDGDGTGVDGVVSHSLEDDSRTVNGVNNGRKSWLGKDDIGGTSGSIGSTLDGNTDVGSGQGRGIVGTVTSHSTQVTETLDSLDNLELVLWEDTGETVGVHDHLVQVGVFATGLWSLLEHLGGVHVVTKTQSSTSLLSDSELITGNHLDLDTESHGVVDGLLGVGSGRVEDRQKTDELETVSWRVLLVTVDILVGDSKSSETSSGKLLDVGFELVLKLGGLVSGAQIDDDTSHTLGGSLEPVVSLVEVGDLSSLVDRVERLEVEELDTLSGHLWVWKRTNDTTVDGVLVLGSGAVGSKETNTLDVPLGVALDVLLVNGELVGGESTGLVGTEDGDTGKLFNGSDSGDNSLVLGELLSTDSEGDGQDSWHGNGDTTDQEHQDVVETSSVRESVAGVQDEDFEEDEDTDGDQTEGTNSGENHLQVTNLVVVLSDKGGSSTEEGVGTGGDDKTLGLTLLTGGTGEALVSELLGGWKGFTSKSGLVHGDINGINKSTVGRANVTVLESNDITWNEFGGFDLFPSTVSLDSSFGGEGVHESLDSVTGVSLFDETDGRVDDQEEDDTDEVLPIRGLTTTVGESDGDESSTLHDPRQRVPHEGQELEDDVLRVLLELVGTEDADSVDGLGLGETTFGTLKELEDLLHDDVLDVDLVFVVQVGGSKLDSVHVDLGMEITLVLLLHILVLSLLLLWLGGRRSHSGRRCAADGLLCYFLVLRHDCRMFLGCKGGKKNPFIARVSKAAGEISGATSATRGFAMQRRVKTTQRHRSNAFCSQELGGVLSSEGWAIDLKVGLFDDQLFGSQTRGGGRSKLA